MDRATVETTKETENDTPTYLSDIESKSLRLLEVAEATEKDMEQWYTRMLEQPEGEEMGLHAASLKRATTNITKALTRIYRVSDEFNARLKDINKQKKRHTLPIATPANASIDWSESRTNHFAKGINLYKLLLICFVGSLAGVVIELIWCLVTNGYIESRSGLVYGPFNLLYGVGAVALTVCLYAFRNRSGWLSFLGGAIVGSVIEYGCSWGQEWLFGSRSWDYSHMPFNLNGRICLLYSLFWGCLGVLWIKRIYPLMAKGILQLPDRAGKILTWVLTVFFVFNAFMTVASMTRWTQRMEGVAPSNGFEAFIDERFPDERMERVFANMEFVEKDA